MIIVRRLCELATIFKRAGPDTKEFRSDDRTCIMRKVYRLLQFLIRFLPFAGVNQDPSRTSKEPGRKPYRVVIVCDRNS